MAITPKQVIPILRDEYWLNTGNWEKWCWLTKNIVRVMNGLYIISFHTVTSGNIEHLQHMYTMSALSCWIPCESYKRCHLRRGRIRHCQAISPRYVQPNTVSVEGNFLSGPCSGLWFDANERWASWLHMMDMDISPNIVFCDFLEPANYGLSGIPYLLAQCSRRWFTTPVSAAEIWRKDFLEAFPASFDKFNKQFFYRMTI